MKLKLASIIIAVCFAGLAHSEPKQGLSGTDLYELCGTKSVEAESTCKMWIGGFTAGLFIAGNRRLEKLCLPSNDTGRQNKLIIEKFMREHPEMLHFPAHLISYTALALAFPCGANSN